MSTRSGLSDVVGGGCGVSGCLTFLAVNLLIGGLACRYCLMHWLPGLHHAFPATFNLPDPNMSLWPGPVLLGLIGGELFIPGAIITWLLIGMGILQ